MLQLAEPPQLVLVCSSAYKHKMIWQSVWWTDTRTFVKDFKKEKEEFYLSLGRSGQLYLAELHSLVQSYILIDLRTENRQNIRAEQRVFRCSRLYSSVKSFHTSFYLVKPPHARLELWVYYCKFIVYFRGDLFFVQSRLITLCRHNNKFFWFSLWASRISSE